ncbi:MAG: hypothetical protein JOY54_18765 [Acidobacteriaceae bacterium]|nr:hypothetical protein [Acidobacteriaceae bacterium]
MKASILSLLLVLTLAGCRTRAAVSGTPPQQLPSDTKTALTWDDCVKAPGAVVEQTYPEICVTPDGRKAVRPKQ